MIDKNAFVHAGSVVEHPIVASSGSEIHNSAKVGRYSALGRNSILYANTSVGRFCSIGRFVEVGLARHPIDWLSTHVFQFNSSSFKGDHKLDKIVRRKRKEFMHPPTVIGHDVWIGAKVSVASGVTVGSGSVIFANAAVVKDVGPYEKYAGIPAKKVGQRFSDEIIADLMSLEWWDLPVECLKSIKFESIKEAIAQLKDIRGLLEAED